MNFCLTNSFHQLNYFHRLRDGCIIKPEYSALLTIWQHKKQVQSTPLPLISLWSILHVPVSYLFQITLWPFSNNPSNFEVVSKYGEGSTVTKPQAWSSLLAGHLQLLIQHMRSYCPYLEAACLISMPC